MSPVVPFGNPYAVLSSVGLVDVEVTQYEIHVPVDDGETFLGASWLTDTAVCSMRSRLSRDDEWSWRCGSGWRRCEQMAASLLRASPC